MPSTGNTFPGVGENVDRAGSTAWTNPGNITADDGADATTTNTASDYLVARSFGFAIPDNATILGITVRIEISESASGTENMTAQLQDDSGASIGEVKGYVASGTGKVIHTLGGAADLWTVSNLTPAIVNHANFGVRTWYVTAHSIQIDFITMAIEYAVQGHPLRRRMLRSHPVYRR